LVLETSPAPVEVSLAASGAARRHAATSGGFELDELAVEPHAAVPNGLRPIAQRRPVQVGAAAVKLNDHLGRKPVIISNDLQVGDRDPARS
jgi:hypothetical protein